MVVNSTINNKFGLKLGGPDGFTRFNLLADGSVWAGDMYLTLTQSLIWAMLKMKILAYLISGEIHLFSIIFREWSGSLVEKCLTCVEFEKRCPGVNVEMELIRKILHR